MISEALPSKEVSTLGMRVLAMWAFMSPATTKCGRIAARVFIASGCWHGRARNARAHILGVRALLLGWREPVDGVDDAGLADVTWGQAGSGICG